MRKRMNRFTMLSVIGTLLSFVSILLYYILFSPDTFSQLIDCEFSSELLMEYVILISALISVFIEIRLIISIRKEVRRQKKAAETFLLYSMISNKGEEFYQNKMDFLIQEEMLTRKELQKMQTLHEEITKNEADTTLEDMRDSIDCLLYSFD